jgi:hypothetical protein
LACTCRIFSRPARSGRSTAICRSNRPGRSSVGSVDRDLPVEPAGPQQCGVEDVGPVRRGDEDDAALDVEAVHLDEQLVQRLLPLVVPTAEAGAAVPADGVDLVDEHDRGGVGLRLLEQVADAGGADADEHLDEVRAGDRVEGDPGLTRDGAGEQGLPGAWGSVEEHALGDLRADRLELRRVLEEVLDLVELLDGLVHAGHVGERRLRHVLGDDLRLGLAEVHDPRAATLHLVHEEEQQQQDEEDRPEGDQQGHEQPLGGDLGHLAVGRRHLLDQLGEQRSLRLDVVGLDLVAVLQVDPDLLVLVDQRHLLGVAVLDRGDDLRGVLLLVAACLARNLGGDEHEKDGQDDPEDRAAEDALGVHREGRRSPRPS